MPTPSLLVRASFREDGMLQMEPVYGGRSDTAGYLRGCCATALARTHYPETHYVLVNLLTDLAQAALDPRLRERA